MHKAGLVGGVGLLNSGRPEDGLSGPTPPELKTIIKNSIPFPGLSG